MNVSGLYKILFFTFFILISFHSFSQEISNKVIRDSVPDLNFEPDSLKDQPKKKKKKPKKNIFYGIKAKKGFTREGVEDKQVIELFYCLKKYREPTSYIEEIYVWDRTKGKIIRVKQEELKTLTNFRILHGPYSKFIGGQLVEHGIFYIGTKHGRWEKYKWEKKWWEAPPPGRFNNQQAERIPILMAKTKYYKGWQKEAKMSYYDTEREKVKEVIPCEYGEKTGDYYFFLENGQIYIKGHYADGKKIGLWTEYFKDKNKKQKEFQYPKTQYDEGEPYLWKEWDEKGNVLVLEGKKVDQNTKVEKDPIKRALKKKK